MKHRYHELLIFSTFAVLILLGAAALLLPFVHHTRGLSLLDALFTATSATCVTGLITVPTTGFNVAGQLIILALIQTGAIGIMTLTASFILFLRGELTLEDRLAVSRLSLTPTAGDVEGVLKVVIKYTFAVEALGFVFLALGFRLDGFTLTDSMYHALFHTISAFCNAGFSTFDTSLQGVNGLIKITVMSLIVLGGIGYYVVFDLMEFIKKRDRLTIHTKVILSSVPVFILAGAAILYFTEHGSLCLLDSLFQSVTARTAGFNTIALTDLHPLGQLTLILLMIIGAAPGSTGGGMKLTTFCVMLAATYNTFRGREAVTLFGRQLPRENIAQAYATAVLYLIFLVGSGALLLYYENGEFLKTMFEMTSAVGTVGLSLGLTGEIGPAGKIILICGMFVGRIGPAILALLLLREKKTSSLEYPLEKIILG